MKDVVFILDTKVVEQWTHQIRLLLIQLSDNNINKIYDIQRGRIQSSLYAFEDCQSVIDEYKEWEDSEVKSYGYLHLYGILQALFLQQDSIKNLRKAITGIHTNFRENHKGLHHVRQIRNKTVGHPTDKNGDYFLIIQTSINKYGYQLVAYEGRDKGAIIDVDVFGLLEKQDTEINVLMNVILKELIKL